MNKTLIGGITETTYYQHLNDNQKAQDDFAKALEIDSTYVNAINYRGLIFVEEGKYEEAIKEYERGIALKEIDRGRSLLLP